MGKLLSPFGKLLSALLEEMCDYQLLSEWTGESNETIQSWMSEEISMPSDKALDGLSKLSKMSPTKLRGIIASSNESVRELNEAFAKPLTS